jgi:hypothetical protein
MLTFDVNMKALEAKLDQLGSKSEKAARLGARAGSDVFYKAVLSTVPVSKHGHWFQGTSAKAAKGADAKRAASYWFESGSLKAAVYQVYAKESTATHPEYQIAWNHRKVPYGFMVTYGTKTPTKANKFISRAETTAKSRAKEAMQNKFNEVMNER